MTKLLFLETGNLVVLFFFFFFTQRKICFTHEKTPFLINIFLLELRWLILSLMTEENVSTSTNKLGSHFSFLKNIAHTTRDE